MLPDVLADGLDVVFVGTAAGRRSAALGAYYAGPGNRFWPTLFAMGLTPTQLRPVDFRSLPRYRLGLTDLAKYVSGADATLRATDFAADALRHKLAHYRPRWVAFTSKRAGVEFFGHAVDYGPQAEPIGPSRAFVLSSPSGLARGSWREGRHWHELAALLRAAAAGSPDAISSLSDPPAPDAPGMNFDHVELRNDPAAAWYVKRETVQVRFAPAAGAIASREGANHYGPGDALITGSNGDCWSVTRARFDARYEPVPPLAPGTDGAYRNRPLPVLARQVAEDFTVRRAAGGDLLQGRSGDWLMQYAPGDWGIVEDRKFRTVYHRQSTSDAPVSSP